MSTVLKRVAVAGLVLLAAGAEAAKTKSADSSVVKCTVELDRALLTAGRTHKAVVRISLDADQVVRAGERAPVNLAVVLDRSGSMGGEKLEKAKEAAIEALRRLDGRDIFSLVVYESNVETVVPAQSAANTEWIEARIRSIRTGGSTALFGGVSQGAAEVRKNLDKEYVNRVILLSDGLANVGPRSPEDLGRLGTGLMKEGISVTTVGVGKDYNEDLMARLAQNSDGNTYFAESSRDLPRIFKAELGDVLSVVARDVNLIIECPEGVRPVGVIGRDVSVRGRTVEVALNQLYGGQKKFALLEVEIPSGAAGESRPVASAMVRYENLVNQKREESSASVEVSFTAVVEEAEKSVNAEVKKDVELNLAARAQDDAITLADQGKAGEAAQALRQAAESLKKTAEKLDDSELAEKAQEAEKQAAAIEANSGMTREQRKTLRADSYRTYNQQSAQ